MGGRAREPFGLSLDIKLEIIRVEVRAFAAEAVLGHPMHKRKRDRCLELVCGRLPILEPLCNELGPLLRAPAVKHVEV